MRIFTLALLAFSLVTWLIFQANPNALAAESPEKLKTPRDFFMSELALGSFTAALGWGAATLATSFWRDAYGCKEDTPTLAWCALVTAWLPTIAAPVGVFAMGELSGVNGNLPFAILGTAVAGLSLYTCVSDPRGAGKTIWCKALYLSGVGLIITPALLATIGYNWRARMKMDFSSLAVQLALPLVALRF
jgi:hypothetical protein